MKKLSLTSLTCIVIANMIGAGIFTTSGLALFTLPSPSLVMLAWLIGGILALCGAHCYGLLSQKLTASGGEYIFLSRFFHPVVGYAAGTLSLVVGFSGASAFSALTLARYFSLEIHPVSSPLFATQAVLFVLLLRILQFRLFAHLQNFFVGLQLCLITAFIALSFWIGPNLSNAPAPNPPFSILSLSTVVIWAFYSYTGFNAAVYISARADRPKVNVPRAMLYGTIITTIIYLLLNRVFLFWPSYSLIAGKPEIAASAAYAIGGQALASLTSYIIMLALLSALYSMFLLGPAVFQAMQQDGLMPTLTYRNSNSYLLATMVQGFMVITFIWATSLQNLLSYIGMTLSISMATTVSVVFFHKRLRHEFSFWKKIPSAAFLVFMSGIIGFSMVNEPNHCLASLLTILLVIASYFPVKNFLRNNAIEGQNESQRQ